VRLIEDYILNDDQGTIHPKNTEEINTHFP